MTLVETKQTSLDRRFWRFYTGSATSNLADGMGRTVLPLLAAATTRNPVLISGLVSFGFLPWLLFALPSGAVIDRVDRRRAMATANIVRAGCAAGLALLVLGHAASIGWIYVVAFLLGAAETVYDSSTRALLPNLVGRADLDRANGLLTVEETLGQTFVGAPVGSVLFAFGAAVPLLLGAGGFTVAALVVLSVVGSFRPARAERGPADGTALRTIRRDMAEGVRWLRGHRFLRELTLISAVTSLVQSMGNGVFVLYVLDELRLPSADFGLVLLLAGVGGLIGGVTTPIVARRIRRGPLLTGGALLAGLATLAMGFTRDGYLGATFFAVAALGVMIWNVLTMSLRQALIPPHMFGRVQGAYRTLVWGAIPLGSLAGGFLADRIGVRPVFVVAGVALASCSGWLGLVVRHHRLLLEDVAAIDEDDGHAR